MLRALTGGRLWLLKKAGKGDGPYCKIHRTKGHDLQECHQIDQLVKKQKAEYEKRDKERDQDGVGGRAEATEEVAPARPLGIRGNLPEVVMRSILRSSPWTYHRLIKSQEDL